jgi:hypothetical protein
MSGAIPPLPEYAFMAWCLVQHRNNFTFTSTFTKVHYSFDKSSPLDPVLIHFNLYARLGSFHRDEYSSRVVWCHKPESHDFSSNLFTPSDIV